MTIPLERTRSLLQTREFLQELLNPEKTLGIPEDIRRQARVLLRHYPGNAELHLAHQALPHLFDAVRSEVELGERIARNLEKPEPGKEAG